MKGFALSLVSRVKNWILVFGLLALTTGAAAQKAAGPNPEGRWDITVYDNDQQYPSWLEVYHSGHKRLVGHYVGITGSARPISIVHFDKGVLRFSIPPQWEAEDNDLQFEARLDGDSLVGTFLAANGKKYDWIGRRAPRLVRDTEPTWGEPIQLFNGQNLDGWKALGNNQWVVENGVLKSPSSGANLVSDQKFSDFKLHIEFRCPPGSNSGVYLRGRYEVQIEDSYGKEPQKDYLGAVYGFIKPSLMAAKPAGEWQSYDITLVGRMITVVANGKMIICNQEIPGITGGALDSHEGEPGPLLIQGDHGPIEYRNIVITPGK
jgi:hypothetical protein